MLINNPSAPEICLRVNKSAWRKELTQPDKPHCHSSLSNLLEENESYYVAKTSLPMTIAHPLAFSHSKGVDGRGDSVGIKEH
jgi:hypothetical protein